MLVLATCAVVLAGCGNDAGSGTRAPSVPESAPPSELPSQTLTSTPTPSAISTAITPGLKAVRVGTPERDPR
jgi:hypothetical protein